MNLSKVPESAWKAGWQFVKKEEGELVKKGTCEPFKDCKNTFSLIKDFISSKNGRDLGRLTLALR